MQCAIAPNSRRSHTTRAQRTVSKRMRVYAPASNIGLREDAKGNLLENHVESPKGLRVQIKCIKYWTWNAHTQIMLCYFKLWYFKQFYGSILQRAIWALYFLLRIWDCVKGEPYEIVPLASRLRWMWEGVVWCLKDAMKAATGERIQTHGYKDRTLFMQLLRTAVSYKLSILTKIDE